MSFQVILKVMLHQPFIDDARSFIHTPAAEHTPETEGFAPEKKTLSVQDRGCGLVRGDKQPPISMRGEMRNVMKGIHLLLRT